MSRGRRRRDARRRARDRRPDQPRERPPDEDVSAETADARQEGSRGGEEHLTLAAAGRHSRAARKRAKRKGGLWERVGRLHVSPWLIATPGGGTGVMALVVLIVPSGSAGSTGDASATPDPRVAGQTPAASINLTVNDVNFSQTELTGNAGEGIEFGGTN